MVNERWCCLHGGVRKDISTTALPTTTEQEMVSFIDLENIQEGVSIIT